MLRPPSFLSHRGLRRLCRNYQTRPDSYKKLNKPRSLLIVSAGSVLAYGAGSLAFGGEKFYRDVAMPVVHMLLDGEDAHRLAVKMAQWNLVPLDVLAVKYPALETEVFGLRFPTPLGLAAGFDKDGEAVGGIHKMGFAFVEVGSVTPHPQDGNPKPRVFRLPEDGAVINRYGFNSAGHDVVFQRLHDFRQNSTPPPPPASTSFTRNSLPEVVVKDAQDSSSSSSINGPSAILGVNLGKNKTSPSPIGDYVSGAVKFAPLADYLVINVSSPNTPGLRDMQGRATLEALLDAVLDKLNSLPAGSRRPPLLIKIAPDLANGDVDDVVDVLLQRSGPQGVAGVIISNTTISRPSTLHHSETAKETGGLSGKPLRNLSTEMIKRVYLASGGKIPIIGCGGISSGADAYEKIRAGASLIQIYSALVFGGPPIVKSITRELNQLLLKDGFENIEQAVGTGALDQVDLKAIRNGMRDMVLEKFAEQQASMRSMTQSEEHTTKNPLDEKDQTEDVSAGGDDSIVTVESQSKEDNGGDVLIANYYNVPASHMRRKTSQGIPSAS